MEDNAKIAWLIRKYQCANILSKNPYCLKITKYTTTWLKPITSLEVENNIISWISYPNMVKIWRFSWMDIFEILIIGNSRLKYGFGSELENSRFMQKFYLNWLQQYAIWCDTWCDIFANHVENWKILKSKCVSTLAYKIKIVSFILKFSNSRLTFRSILSTCEFPIEWQ